MNNFNSLARAPWGPCLYNRNDVTIGHCLEVHGEYSEEELETLRLVVPVGSIMLDIGANIGALAVPMAMHVGPTGAVVAIEPQRLMYQLLCANAALNSVANLHAMRAAMGDRFGEIEIAVLDPTTRAAPGALELGRKEGEGIYESVTVMCIDDLDPATLARVSLIKIDVEGMELAVLAGASKTIAKHRPFLYLENDREQFQSTVIRTLMDLNYKVYWDLPRLVRLGAPGERSKVSNAFSLNMLAFPKEHKHTIGLEPCYGPDDKPQAAMDRTIATLNRIYS